MNTSMLKISGLLLLLTAGCNSMQYSTTEDLWAEADTHFDQGQYDEALPYYDELLDRHEDDGLAVLMRGVSEERLGESRLAARDYNRAGESGDPRGYLYSANMHIRMGDHAAAEAALGALQSMNLNGRDRVAQLALLGTLRVEQGQYRMAAQSLERAVEEGKRHSDPTTRGHVQSAHYNVSQAYYFLGDFGRAYGHFLAFAGAAPGPEGGYPRARGLNAEDAYMAGLLAYLARDFDSASHYLSQADPVLVARGAEVLGDPNFGAASHQGFGAPQAEELYR